jgi:hypothetical protein|tara:strand:+ start:392 stop:499 length:108 start_codon:yes stop_codon:yes gene_type:complete
MITILGGLLDERMVAEKIKIKFAISSFIGVFGVWM